jgi:hypothetical protein
MKCIAVSITAFALQFAIAPRSRSAESEITFDYFYDSLQPAGEWSYSDDYGYCWSPQAAREEAWRPYTDGSWVLTDNGWTWVSNEDYGWITYHYGRWARLKDRWWWVPGFEWSPAWVSWRQTDREIGWAPLPPEAQWVQDTGFQTWTDSHYDIGPAWYNFVTVDHFGEPEVRRHLVATTENARIIENSANVTNITYKENVVNHIYVGGPDVTRIERAGGPKIRRLELRVAEDFRGGRGDRDGRERRNFTRVEGNSLVMAAPRIRREENIRAPQGVRVRFERQAIDRGWGGRDGRDSGEFAARLREKYREEGGREERGKLPPKAAQSPLAVAPPASLPPAREGENRNADTSGRTGPADPNAPRSETAPDTARRPGERPDPTGRDTNPRAPGNIPPAAGNETAVRPGARPGTSDPADPNMPRSGRDAAQPSQPNAPRPGEPSNDSRKPEATRPGTPNTPSADNPAVRPGAKPGTVDPANPNSPRPGLDNPRPSQPNQPGRTNQPNAPRPGEPSKDAGKPDAARPGTNTPPDRSTPAPDAASKDPKNPKEKPGKPTDRERTDPSRPAEETSPRPKGEDNAKEVKPSRPSDPDRSKPSNPEKSKPRDPEKKDTEKKTAPPKRDKTEEQEAGEGKPDQGT